MYIPSIKLISQSMMKKSPENCSLAGSSTNSPSSVFVHQRAKNCPTMTKISRGQDSLYKCVYQIWGLYINLEAMNAEKLLWPIFGCKVRQSVLIGMKLELDVWYYLLNVYTRFEIDISKHVEKKPGKHSSTTYHSARRGTVCGEWHLILPICKGYCSAD